MDRPARGDHRLLVMHHNVTRFLRLPHHVENAGVIIHIEIEINFHPALVGVTRHGVPQVTQTSSVSPILNWQVSSTSGTKYLLIVRRLLVRLSPNVTGDTSSGVTFGGIRRMRGCAIVIKLRRSGGINTGKDNFFAPLPTYRASR